MKNINYYTDFINEKNFFPDSFSNIPKNIQDYIDNFVKTNTEKATEIAMKFDDKNFKEIFEILKKENQEAEINESVISNIKDYIIKNKNKFIFYGLTAISTIVLVKSINYLSNILYEYFGWSELIRYPIIFIVGWFYAEISRTVKSKMIKNDN
jgi:hypothetical protein